MPRLQIGDYASFSYDPKYPHRDNDTTPQVLVLHPNWQGHLHGINFNQLTHDEINTIRMLLDPMFELKYRKELERKNRSAYQELERLITTKPEGSAAIFSNPRIYSPKVFYENIIKKFIYPARTSPGKNAYRLYIPSRMSNVRILTPSRVMLGQDDFKKLQAQDSKAARAIEELIAHAKTPEEKEAATQALANFEAAKTPEERKSVFQWFKDKFQHFRGPRF